MFCLFLDSDNNYQTDRVSLRGFGSSAAMHFRRPFPVGSPILAAKFRRTSERQGSFGHVKPGDRSGDESPILPPFKSSDTLFTATPSGGSFGPQDAWNRDICPYATFQLPRDQQMHQVTIKLQHHGQLDDSQPVASTLPRMRNSDSSGQLSRHSKSGKKSIPSSSSFRTPAAMQQNNPNILPLIDQSTFLPFSDVSFYFLFSYLLFDNFFKILVHL